MIVFDVDGTLIGGEQADWKSFDEAFAEAAGKPFDPGYFVNLEEVTAKSIVHRALSEHPVARRHVIEAAVRDGFVQRLKAAHADDHAAFPAVKGAAELLARLRAEGVPVAIATGDWRESICFKLSAAGLDYESIPMCTSSDYFRRAEIIAAAVDLAGGKLGDAVYVGDGVWDLRACLELGIPFVGVGARREILIAQGARHTLDDLSPMQFWEVMKLAQATRA